MATAASSATAQAQITHSPYRTYGVSPVVAVTVASSRVRSNSLVCWCTTPLASMTAEIPEIAACTSGPSGLGRAHLPDRDVLGGVRRTLVGAVVGGHHDHLRAGVHERPDLISERRLEADDRRDLVARDLEDPGRVARLEVARDAVELADAPLELGAERDVLAERYEVPLGVGPLDRAVGPEQHIEVQRLRAPAGRPFEAGASATAFASTHACVGGRRPPAGCGDTGRCGDRRPCSTPGTRPGRPDRASRPPARSGCSGK